MQNLNVRDWYMIEFPTDEVGERIKKDVTFFDVMGALLTGKCVYETMMGNYGDSIFVIGEVKNTLSLPLKA